MCNIYFNYSVGFVLHVCEFYTQVQLEYILEREGGWDSVQVSKMSTLVLLYYIIYQEKGKNGQRYTEL